jgi:DNA (cytosine-5)-methyltransferase 1
MDVLYFSMFQQLRQIGNAVAVPFALALGKELGKAMILEWEENQREGSVVL